MTNHELRMANHGDVKTAGRRVLRSEEIFGESREVVIRHKEQEYRLQVTRNGKLILIK
jgi:hemin uptake protein HemP